MLIDTIIVDPEDIRAVVRANMPAVIEVAFSSGFHPMNALEDILRLSGLPEQDIKKAVESAHEYLFEHRHELPWTISPPETMSSWRTSG